MGQKDRELEEKEFLIQTPGRNDARTMPRALFASRRVKMERTLPCNDGLQDPNAIGQPHWDSLEKRFGMGLCAYRQTRMDDSQAELPNVADQGSELRVASVDKTWFHLPKPPMPQSSTAL